MPQDAHRMDEKSAPIENGHGDSTAPGTVIRVCPTQIGEHMTLSRAKFQRLYYPSGHRLQDYVASDLLHPHKRSANREHLQQMLSDAENELRYRSRCINCGYLESFAFHSWPSFIPGGCPWPELSLLLHLMASVRIPTLFSVRTQAAFGGKKRRVWMQDLFHHGKSSVIAYVSFG
ncbi:hypothetical protein EV356DRAFT_501436 [Viridothelium virens]|uniref:Uncharacterized protein n=1 Tax=Viridothelium virens TaxID=1048519 RepID=A0A6A6H8Z8_VIRVR|nr:hypothetical protein EV356DRAFT_501436 [Viridothelium virens]